jgi:hypothetical protein
MKSPVFEVNFEVGFFNGTISVFRDILYIKTRKDC